MIGKLVQDKYRIDRKIGAGGMGVVYQGEDVRLRRKVAVKFLLGDYSKDPLARSRFEREAQMASALDHPHICRIYDVGEHEGQPYLVMELLKGMTLKQLIGRKPVKRDRLIEIASEVADALDAAHSAGVIHRDIKTSNIFVDSRGAARLLDFGLAKMAHDPLLQPGGEYDTLHYDPDEVRTNTGTVLGTMRYMSPEQARGDVIDHRSDLFSLGGVMYEMATGSPPFGGSTIAVTFDEIFNKTPAPISKKNPDIGERLELVIDKLLAKSVDERIQSAGQLLALLHELKEGGATLMDLGDVTASIPGTPADSSPSGQRDSSPSPSTPSASSTPSAREPAGPPSVAVLPLVNLSGNPENDYFGDGLADELISALMKVPGLQVVARTSTFQFKGKSLDVREIGRQLNATSVLEGSFRMAGNRIRISANFINVADGYQIWTDRFDREMEDVFAVQDEIARTIVHGLEMTLTGGSTSTSRGGLQSRIVKPQTQNVEAYNQYLRGRFHWKKRTPDAIHKAIDCFREALEIDPEYAAAYAGLADCYAMLGIYTVLPRTIVMPQARQAAEKALALDDSQADAHAALGVVAALHDFQWHEAEKRFQRALELAPDSATARYWLAIFVLLPNARFDEAMGQAEWAAQLDPVNPAITAASGLIHFMRGQYKQGVESIQSALDLDPTHPLSNLILGWCHVCLGDFDKAIAAFDNCQAMRVVATGGQGWAHARAGREDEARRCLEALEEMLRHGNTQAEFEMARILIDLGEHQRAVECLEHSHETGSGGLYWLKVNRLFDPLREMPRFQELLKQLSLADD